VTSRLHTLIELLHTASDAALATHSLDLPGYPFASSVAYATDEHHRPLLLISRLALHTQNLAADPRASLMVARALGDGEMARITVLGDLQPIEADDLLTARYLRFNPDSERFLALGDFHFHRLEPRRIRVIGGFAEAGWLDPRQLLSAPWLGLADEARLIAAVAPQLSADRCVLGVDAHGIDLRVGSRRERLTFKAGPVTAESALPALRRALQLHI
jgi:putative heme iron utilization protein